MPRIKWSAGAHAPHRQEKSVCDFVQPHSYLLNLKGLTLLLGCTHIFDDAHQTDGASFADVVLAAAQDERRRNHYVQIEVVRHGAGPGRHLKANRPECVSTHRYFISSFDKEMPCLVYIARFCCKEERLPEIYTTSCCSALQQIIMMSEK
jgi:hypothetical protein